MASGVYEKARFIACALLAVVHVARGNLTLSEASVSSLESLPYSGKIPLSIEVISNIGRPGVLLYNLESESVITMKYSLNCSSYDAMYTIFATTSARHVAVITSHDNFNISCAASVNVSLEHRHDINASVIDEARIDVTMADDSTVLGVVEGEVNMTVKANTIGRAFLILTAHKFSDLNPSVVKDDHSIDGHSSSFSTYNGLSPSTHDEPSPYKIHSLINNSSDSSMVTEAKTESLDYRAHEQPTKVVGKAMVIVMQLPRTFDEIFRIVLYVVIVLSTIGMGVKVDFVVIKNVLRRPIAPIIGLCCQYICMPVIAYVVAKVVPQESPAVSLGIFTCGIAPGGGPSNMFTYLLGGDLTLSVTMTTLSSIAALGLLPLWLFTLGNTFKDDTVEMHVPYEKILEALAVAILPLFVGMFIKYKVPRAAKIISKILKPVLLIIVTFIISFGVYTNFYIFKMIRPMTIVAGCLLPYFGYLIGGVIAFLCCRTWTHIKTIAIETGIQNTAIAFLILFLSLPPPDNQLAAVGPASSAIMTPLPLFVSVLLYMIYQRCTKKAKLKALEIAELENGNIQKEKSQEASKQEDELALIIILWRKLTGHRSEKDLPNGKGLIKEMDAMLPKKEVLAKN